MFVELVAKYFTPYKWLIYAGLIVSLLGYLTYEKHSYDERRREEGAKPYQEAIGRQKQEAREKLAAETERVKATERERDGRIATIVERYSDERIKSNADFNKRLAAAGRLRDPEAGRGNSGCRTTSAETGNAGATSGASGGEGIELSASLTTLLKDLIRDTDALISHDRLCMAYAREVSR